MDWKEALRLALQSLWANKLRTVLTLIGVVIGVAAVIAVVTLVNGANAYVDQKLNRYGSDVFTVSKMPNLITSYVEYTRYQKRKNITLDDFHNIADHCRRCVAVGAGQGTSATVKAGTDSVTGVTIRGWTSEMPGLNNLNIVEGRAFTPTEEEHASQVAIVGTDIQENLLKGEDPIGREIRVDGVPYTIIGMGEKQGKTLGNSQDNYVAVPITAYQRTYGTTSKSVTLYIKAAGVGLPLELAGDEVRTLMRSARHDRLGEEDSFTLDLNNTFLSLFKTITNLFGAIAIPVAAISLIVGGIVIMNIMLVSVTERTREIGVRKALGARRRDIMLQFLIESGLMSAAGGVFGVFLGILIGFGISSVAGFPMSVAWWSVIAGLVVATGVGIFFGVYPARQAARLDPIVALREM